jgi:purine nucleosidase
VSENSENLLQPLCIIHDCDPGVDDSVALLLALASPDEIEILGITTVAGNVGLDHCTGNARKLCELAGRTDIPVYAGCARPLMKALVTAPEVHGENGIGGVVLPAPQIPVQSQHAVDFIIDTLKSRENVTLCPTGPLTNIALALIKAPEIAPRIREIVVMGGAMHAGNITPVAEFNFYVDPHAAHVVFTSGVPLVRFGLNLTHQVLNTEARIASIRALGSAVATFVAAVLDTLPDAEIKHYGGNPLHDPNVIMYLLRPDLYTGQYYHVDIVTDTGPALAQSIVDRRGRTGRPANALMIERVDSDAFYRILTERLARFSS